MPRPRLAAAVLAAGQSRRFGTDKLLADFGGAPLGLQIVRCLAGLDLAQGWVIAAEADHPLADDWSEAGFTVAANPLAASGQASSVALAAELALAAEADLLLIALADMPLVPLAHFCALLEKAEGLGPAALVASLAGKQRSPPAVFGRARLAELLTLTGDQGARHLLGAAELVACPAEWLFDIDDPASLARALTLRGAGICETARGERQG
jgi:molybdenum cofactor cytidylyltransferase